MSNLPLTIPDGVCLDDVDPFGSETQSDLESLIQDLYHVLVEDPDSNPDDPGRGIGVMRYLSGTEKDFAGLPGIIETQFGADDRVTSVSATTQRKPDGSFTLNINVGVGDNIIPLRYGVSSAGVVPLA